MTHVSKKQLKAAHLNQLFNQLISTTVKLDNKQGKSFYDEFLGPEEKIMLAKRLAAIAMCIEGNSSYRISQSLLMSPSTAERIKLKYEIGKYKAIERALKKSDSHYIEFWRLLETILQAGMPPQGRGRWKSVLKHL